MNYILLDTNIIIDMVVDRRNQIKNNVLTKYVKLLDSGEIKMIIPEIIKVETYRNLGNEFEKVKGRIEAVLESIEKLYGVSTLQFKGLDLSEYKKKAKSELNNALEEFEKNEKKYRTDIYDTIALIFSHKNSIVLSDIDIMNNVLKRKFYRRAPFHKVEKESNGDGIITELLINIKKFIKINPDDTIYFVTGNYKDFSDLSGKGKEFLHKDIVGDLNQNGLGSNVIYVRTFGELIGGELKSNIENMELLEELEREYEIQQEIERELYEKEIKDFRRSSVGLTTFDSFEYKVEEYLNEFNSDLENIYTDFKTYKEKIEEIISFYTDECFEIVSEVELNKLCNLFNKIKQIYYKNSEEKFYNIYEFREWLDNRKCEWENIKISDNFSNINFGESRVIYDVEGNEYLLSIEELYLIKEGGQSDEIRIELMSDDEKKLGGIHIMYGKVEFDDDGGVDEALEDEINMDVKDIVKKIKEISNGWNKKITSEMKKIQEIRDYTDDLIYEE